MTAFHLGELVAEFLCVLTHWLLAGTLHSLIKLVSPVLYDESYRLLYAILTELHSDSTGFWMRSFTELQTFEEEPLD